MSHLFYFLNCKTCAYTDGGTPINDYLAVDCPSCGSPNVQKWPALPNLSREWAYCEEFGHDWAERLLDKTVEDCRHCHATRKFNPSRNR